MQPFAAPLLFAREPASAEGRIVMQATHLLFDPLAGFNDMVMAAARCWRGARDRGAPVQQRLYALLSPRGFDMLAPVLDSLLTLYEATLGRKFVTGPAVPSSDECLLLNLLDGSISRQGFIPDAEGQATSLDCAIISTRIMASMAKAEEGERERSANRMVAR
jgi:hypothetical protein